MKLTSLYDSHVELNAKIVPFAGYQMPVTYKKITEEYKAVRENCGMFDVSHIGQILIEGEDSFNFIQFMTVNDVSRWTIFFPCIGGFSVFLGLVLNNMILNVLV